MTTRIQLFVTVLVVLIVHGNCSIVYHLDALKNAHDAASEFKVTDQVITCSTWLSQMINDLCNNVFKIVKRDTMPMSEIIHSGKTTNENYVRTRRQVASECCEKPCSVADLISYCPPDAALIKTHPDLFY